MTSRGQKSVLAIWEELPDPTDPAAPEGQKSWMAVPLSTWQHILEKHIRREKEPWKEVLSRPVWTALQNQPVESSHETPEGQATLAMLESQVRQSLERPLVLIYGVRPVDARQQVKKIRYWVWGMVLPSGATAYAHQSSSQVELKTCYFPKPANVKQDRGQRWKHTVKQLLWRYCPRGEGRLQLPAAEHQVLVRPAGERPQYRSRIRFVTWRTWGFLSEEPGSPWRGRVDRWPAAEPPDKPPRKPRRLRPWKKTSE